MQELVTCETEIATCAICSDLQSNIGSLLRVNAENVFPLHSYTPVPIIPYTVTYCNECPHQCCLFRTARRISDHSLS